MLYTKSGSAQLLRIHVLSHLLASTKHVTPQRSRCLVSFTTHRRRRDYRAFAQSVTFTLESNTAAAKSTWVPMHCATELSPAGNAERGFSSSGGSSSSGFAESISSLAMNFQNAATVEEFKTLMHHMQAIRRDIVTSLLSGHHIQSEWVDLLRTTYDILNANTADFQREMISSKGDKFQVNVKDEIIGLQKDLKFLDHVKDAKQSDSTMPGLLQVDFCEILAPYHPISKEKFLEEYANCTRFMRSFVNSASEEGRKPIFVTDWDGTMKDYCSQYATNLQPIYSAISMAQFASRFTRLTAVLTAGPLRGPGILDLTALPIDGPVMFSGSWGREWWLGGKRVVHDDGISNEGIDALERFNDEMRSLLSSAEYSQFGLVGSGVQRKVDRLTLGVQTVCKHVHPDLSNRYQDEVRERVHRVDPQKQILHFDPSTELEVEIVVQSDGSVWNKANGVERLIETVGDTLHPPGRVLICGDTSSDLPMVQHAVQFNPQGVMSLFVGAKPELRSKVLEIVGDEERVCFVSCPDVVHAAMTQILKEFKERREPTDIKRNSENGTTAVENHI